MVKIINKEDLKITGYADKYNFIVAYKIGDQPIKIKEMSVTDTVEKINSEKGLKSEYAIKQVLKDLRRLDFGSDTEPRFCDVSILEKRVDRIEFFKNTRLDIPSKRIVPMSEGHYFVTERWSFTPRTFKFLIEESK